MKATKLSVNIFKRRFTLTIEKGVAKMKGIEAVEVKTETRIEKLAREYFEERQWVTQVVFQELTPDGKMLTITLVDRDLRVRTDVQMQATDYTLARGAQDIADRYDYRAQSVDVIHL